MRQFFFCLFTFSIFSVFLHFQFLKFQNKVNFDWDFFLKTKEHFKLPNELRAPNWWTNARSNQIQIELKPAKLSFNYLLFVPTFDTKVTEYLCSGGFFFSSDKFRLLKKPFLTDFSTSFERHCCPELKFEKIFHLWSFFVKLRGFKDCHFGQFGTINARYISRY